MKIAIDTSALRGARTGVGNYTYSLLRAMLRQPDCPTLTGLSTGLRRGGHPPLGFPNTHLPVPTRAMYLCWRQFNLPSIESLLGRQDVYHATNYFLPPAKRARRILTIYDLAFLRVPGLCSPAIVGPFSRSIRRFAAEADAILTCSEASRSDIVELLAVPEEKVTVAHGAVDPEFRPTDDTEAVTSLLKRHQITAPYLLFVSTLEPRKNVAGLLQAFALLQHEIPHTLVLAGREGWNEQRTPELVQELGLAQRVWLPGYVATQDELAHLYAGAEAFVFPSLYEGFGLPVLEALACGCPTVCSRNSSLPEVAGDAAVYVDPEDVDSIASGIRQVLADSELRAALRAKGRVQAAQFTWDQCARTTLDLYRRLA